MAWKDELQDASFRGIGFECTSIKDSTSKTQVVHQAPFSDEAIIEDLGIEPRKISITATFTGNTYKADSDQLIDALNERGTGIFIHPIYGLCNASVLSHNIDHEADNVDACNISIELIIGKNQQTFFTQATVPQSTSISTIINVPATALQNELVQLDNQNHTALFNVVSRIRTGINNARNLLHLTKKTIDDALSPPTYITALVDDFSQLATFDTSISALAKWRDLSKRITRLNSLFKHDESINLQQTWRATVVSHHIALAQAVIAQTRRELSQSTSTITSFTPLELALVRQSVRQAIQHAITAEREINSDLTLINIEQIQTYKRLADEIHLNIQALIEQQPPLTTTIVTMPCTLHWLAHQLYGDYSRASEIQRLNPRLNNPALLLKGMELNVYAR
ncbi:DNA circularization N-terminal domain-containing protein [Acinetobacter sp. B5B]|uniref:DNA circularization protein n=1 Tax=Acinetobacter baretiae TaxID=2605383 RepID=UPI0018C2FB7C|nr:DNA circularization N-terminal domain-containing protein [Acinetobacter baretiae]MBF7683907.1 DNA circularization N-terminal domain-containing protein [Acinetobacter baretiae]